MKGFNWETYLNPQNTDDLKEVFKEGDYTPPLFLRWLITPWMRILKTGLNWLRKKQVYRSTESKNVGLPEKNESVKTYREGVY